MQKNNAYIDIIARDQFTAVIKKFQSDMKSATENVERFQAKARAMGNNLKRVGANMSTFVTAPLAAFGAKSIQAFGQQEEALAQVESALKSTNNTAGLTFDELKNVASGLQEISTYGDEDILKNVTANMLTFTNVTQTEFKRAQQAVLDISTRMGTDLKSTTIQVGKALNDPIAGLSALSRVGIQFSDDQKEVIKALVETGNVAQAQSLILDELSIQYGGAASAAADTTTGKIKQLGNAFGDLTETIGGALAPVLLPMVETLRGLVERFQMLSPKTQRFVVVIGGLAAVVGPLLGILGLLLIGIGGLSVPILLVAGGVSGLIAVWAAWGDDIMEFISNPAEGIRTALLAIEESAISLYEAVKSYLLDKLDAVWDGVTAGVNRVKSVFFDMYDAVVGNSYVPDMVNGVIDWFGRLNQTMPALAQEATDKTTSKMSELAQVGDFLGNKFNSMFDSLIFGGQKTSDIFKSLARDLSKVLIQSTLFGKGPLAGVFGQGLFSGLTARAMGGPVSAGSPYLVGERGPELFMPRTSGQIIPNHAMGGSGGGIVIHAPLSIDARGATQDAIPAIKTALKDVYERLGKVGETVALQQKMRPSLR